LKAVESLRAIHRTGFGGCFAVSSSCHDRRLEHQAWLGPLSRL
jgi:hypothetical protein